MRSAASDVLILGYGNTLRGDDGVGVRAAELLGAQPLHQLAPELAADVARARLVVFIDAAREGEPGELHCRPVIPIAASSELSHHLTPSALLVLARELYGRAPKAFEVTLCGESFDVGETLSPRVQARMGELVEMVRKIPLR